MAIEAARLYVRIGADIGEAQKGISTVSRAVGGMGDIARTALGFFGGQVMMDAVRGLGNMAREAIGATAQFQMLQAGLTSLMAREMVAGGQFKNVSAALDTASGSAKGMLEELAKIAMVSPYQMETVAGTYRLAMAFGYSAEEAKGFTSAILNVAAGTGATNEMLDRMAYNFAQIRLQGKVTAVDIRQLALAGFDLNGVLKYVGKQLGINIENHEDFNRALDSGKITWKQFNELFEKYASENFGGASERMSRTLEGLKSTFKDVFALTMPKLLGPAADVFAKFAGGILNDFMKIRDSGILEDIGGRIGVLAGHITSGRWEEAWNTFSYGMREAFGPALDEISAKIPGLSEMITGFQSGFDKIGAFWTEHGPAITEIFNNFAGSMQEKLSDLAGRVMPWIGEKMAIFGQWFTDNGPLIEQALTVFAERWDTLTTAVVNMWTFVEPILDGALEAILGLGATMLALSTGDWALAWQLFQDTVSTAKDNFMTVLLSFADWVTVTFLGTRWKEVQNVWQTNWDLFKTIVQKVLENTKEIIGRIVDDIVSNVEGQMRSMLSALEGAVRRAGELAKGINFGGGTGGWQIPSGGGGKPSVWMAGERAAGGPVIAGRSYLVGEEGPEMFTPRQSGQIVPNDRLGQSVTINGPIYITAESGDTLGGLLGSIQLLGA